MIPYHLYSQYQTPTGELYILIEIWQGGTTKGTVKLLNPKTRTAYERTGQDFEEALKKGLMKEVL
jgi:hypothetical protein